MDNLTGRNVGGYELKELIATGGMATVYKGFDKRLSRWVAVKIIPTGQAEETLLARFRLEAQAIAALRHRNILTIYSYGEEEDWAYIIMEYVPDGSLKDRIIPGQPLNWEQALNVVIPVSQALAFAHQHGIIHRDIKPANILMPQDDWPLLADFGLAKMEHSSAPSLTMPGQVLGTMAYAAPEQLQDGHVDARIDIYSLAIVLYELLTGRLPFLGETPFDFLMARLVDPPVSILEANPQVSPVFASIMEKALAPNPDDRYPSMNDFSCNLMEARYELTSRTARKPRSHGTAHLPTLKEDRPPLTRLKVATGEEIILEKRNELIIGRGHKEIIPDIDLTSYGGSKAGVSRRHGRLLHQDNQWLVEDLDSTNGTYLNGTRLAPHQPTTVKNGDIIRCGHIELEFQIE
jgi:serine/threonine-protein kinase